jgi:hypothetical protein
MGRKPHRRLNERQERDHHGDVEVDEEKGHPENADNEHAYSTADVEKAVSHRYITSRPCRELLGRRRA